MVGADSFCRSRAGPNHENGYSAGLYFYIHHSLFHCFIFTRIPLCFSFYIFIDVVPGLLSPACVYIYWLLQHDSIVIVWWFKACVCFFFFQSPESMYAWCHCVSHGLCLQFFLKKLCLQWISFVNKLYLKKRDDFCLRGLVYYLTKEIENEDRREGGGIKNCIWECWVDPH